MSFHNAYSLSVRLFINAPDAAAGPLGTEHVNTTATRGSDFVTTVLGGVDTPDTRINSYIFSERGFWVNQTTIDSFGYDSDMTLPGGSYPYSKLAALLPATPGPAMSIYHQLSTTVIAEEVWNEASGAWSSNNITILTD